MITATGNALSRLDDGFFRVRFDRLTPKEREKILQSKNEGFPAEFDDVLADYFRRIARESEGGADGSDGSDN